MYINPEYFIVDFLRNRLTDPRTSRRPTLTSDSFTATASQTEFSLSPTTGKSLQHVSSVDVEGDVKIKWKDYYIDPRDEKIIFFSGVTLNENVEVNYYEGTTNWIYWDKITKTLSSTSFPRIDVLTITGPGKRLGNYEAPVENAILFQIDVWTKEKSDAQLFTIDSKKYTGENLAKYLAFEVMQNFEDNEDDLHPALYDYTPTNAIPGTMPFDEDYQCHHKIVEFIMSGIKLGRIS